MRLGWRGFRTVVGATVLGWLGVVTGCSSGGEAHDPPATGGCEDMSAAECAPAPEPPVTDGEAPPPPVGEVPDEEPPDTNEQPQQEQPPPPPPGPGSTLWQVREGTPQDDLALDAALDASGDILTATVQGIDDMHTRQPTDDRVRLVVTRRSAAGETRWQRTFEVRAPETPAELRASVSARIAPDSTGGVFLAGNVEGLLDFETRELGDGAFVARLDSNGNLLWASTPRGPGLTVVDLTVDAQGRALVAFNSSGTADFGDGARGSGAVVVTYSTEGRAEGALRIGRPEGDEDRVELTTLAVDARGRLAVGGRYVGAVRFGSQRAESTRDGSPFLAVYQDGALTWAKALRQAQGTVSDVGVDGQGAVVATGSFLGTVDWAGRKLQGHPYRISPFLVAARPGGEERWARHLGDGLQVGALAVEPSGDLVLAGFTYNRIEDGVAGSDGMGSAQPVAIRYGSNGGALATRMYLSDPPEARGELFGVEAMPFVGVLPDGDAILFGHTDRDSDLGLGRRFAARSDVFLFRLKR
ncbi:hypothetical protein HPC49_22860 [Pyxidicoccus fallax]|uniref:Lipoprotein n=1 Tax=Pyxidicoccus fallax TaxID=394095 RepID=A0A848LH38_9BACT|nr:hypothetical protein [Pyxidicoccus fallax]NMO15578.1 hypothetical protein [Pyxidicoccus fallax]NPC81053.1 hypothetical protein [Pyxidicoccus fallax]